MRVDDDQGQAAHDQDPGPQSELGTGRRLRFATHSLAETQALARRLGELAGDGWLVLLEGPLGAGKTAFAQGLLAGAGVGGAVTSPTFTLINEYQGRTPVWHADLYRLDDAAAEFADIGGDELLPPSTGLAVLEWADRLGSLGSDEYIWVRIDPPLSSATPDSRLLTLEFRGQRYASASAALAQCPGATDPGREES